LHIITSNEKELVTLLKESNEAAFEELYHLYSRRLLGYLIKLVKSEAFAAELLQDVFVKIWNSRKNIDPEQSFRSYLFRIAENCVYDFYRKAARDKKLQTELIKIATSEYSHVEEDFSDKESAQFLQEAIDALPPKRRQIYRLIKVEERSYDEVSSLLKISTSTISDHIVKATKSIRGKLEGFQDVAVIVLIFFLISFCH